MKKSGILIALALTVLVSGCGKHTAAVDSADTQQQAYIAQLQEQTELKYNDPTISDFEKQFLPQYAIETPEPEQKAAIPAFKSPARQTKGADASVIPGIRPLSAYRTAYLPKIQTYLDSTGGAQAANAEHIGTDAGSADMNTDSAGSQTNTGSTSADSYGTAPQQETDSGSTIGLPQQEPLTVADWGPKGKIPAAAASPAFYAVFSLPVKAISALEAPATESPYLEISPAVKGVYRWYGSRYLAFEPEESLIPGQVYTMKVKDGVRALNGAEITGKREFTITSESLRITYSQPGYTLQNNTERWIYIDRSNVIPEAANDILLSFNYPVQPKDLAQALSVSVQENGKQPISYPYSLSQPEGESLFHILVTIKGTIPFNSKVTLAVARPGMDSTTAAYHTLTPFTSTAADASHSYYRYTNPIHIRFSHPVDEKSILANLSIAPQLPLTMKNIEVNGSSVVLHDLPVAPRETYTLSLQNGITDIYGRKLASNAVYQITIPDAPSFVDYTDQGQLMLEAQYPHKYLFKYQNILAPSSYAAAPTDNPLNLRIWGDAYNTHKEVPLKTGILNTRQFELVDLEPYLTNGKGFVRIDSGITLPSTYSRDKKPRIYRQTSTIQVTDLGITVRSAVNKTLVLVSKLSTGEPVEGASVYLYDAETERENGALSPEEGMQNPFAHAVTGKDGLAILPYDSKSIGFFRHAGSGAAVFVEKDGDRAVFYPRSHNSWQFGIPAVYDPDEIAQSHQRTFLFSDRGLYKPGETVSFRGIDRTQYLSKLSPYTGTYTITLQGYSWEDKQVTIGSIEDTCTESGSFWGAFQIPEDIAPGSYSLVYERTDGKTDSETHECPITIAYFEKLKFQAEVQMPEQPVIMGGTIQASASASYLSGGGLGNAAYSCYWMREGAAFRPNHPSLQKYWFGASGFGIEQVASLSGKLSGSGTAELSCQAALSEGIIGLPYRYSAEISITDLSNQQISARNSVLVHPAALYIGIARPENLTGFARKGQKLSFPFILADPDGTPLADTKHTKGDISVSLIREDWKLVQERGSGGSIYSHYEKENITEYTQAIKPAVTGSIELSPQNAGSYILSVSGTDTAGRIFKTDYSFYVTGSGTQYWNRDFEHAVRLTPDQSLYNPGDTARILMESPLPAGRYLITVEREGIFTEEIRELQDNTQVLEIPIAGNYVPVVYVAVSSYSIRTKEPQHKPGELDLDKPKGIFGVTPIMINPRIKAFSVEIAADKSVYKPGEEVNVTLTATKGGKPIADAELTLLAVDRGVLDLINYHVPNPIEFFYDPDHFPLGVTGGDSRAWLMDPVMEEAKTLAGGDSDGGKGESGDERSDFNPTAVFIPILKTDAKGQVKASFKLPDTLTSYRITAVGTHTDLFALHEEEITVQNTVNVLPVMPRRLRERDTAECGVLISNLDSKSHRITVSAAVREPQLQQVSEQANNDAKPLGTAFIDGTAAHTVTVTGGGQAAVYFDLAAVKAGTVEAVFSISSDVVTETLVQPLTIDRPFVFETVTATGIIAQEDTEAAEGLIIPSAADANTGALSLTLDSSGLGTLAAAINYVFDYPFLCMEQQSARILPLVLFENAIDTFGLKSKVPNVRHTVTKTLAAWAREQHSSGGFPYWQGATESDFYVSLRIAHICAVTRQRGYSPEDIAVNTEQLTAYLKSQLLAQRKNLSPYMQAYTCSILALNGVDIADSVLNAIKHSTIPQIKTDAPQPLDLSTAALLGLTYMRRGHTGDAQQAADCLNAITAACRFTTRSVSLATPPIPRDSAYRLWYGNDLSLDLALILQALVTIAPDHSRDDAVRAVLYTLLQRQKGGYWQNTATTAHVLEAISGYIDYMQLGSTDFTAAANLAGGELLTAAFKGAAAKPVSQEIPFQAPPLAQAKRDTLLPLRFSKAGAGQLYYTASLSYALPQERQQARDEGLGVSYTIRDIAADTMITPESEGTPLITLESGKTYEMTVTLSSGKDYTFVALRAPIPSGAEILDTTFVTTASMQGSSEDSSDSWTDWRPLSAQQIYDSEVQYFWNSWAKGGTTVQFKFRASRRGVFPCPPVTAECMYETEIFGRSSGALFVIK